MVVCEGSEPDLAAVLDDAVSELERVLGCTPTGPAPTPVVTARRLARVRAAARSHGPLTDGHLAVAVSRLRQAVEGPVVVRRSGGRSPYVAQRQSHSIGPVRYRADQIGQSVRTTAQMPSTTHDELDTDSSP